MPTPTTLHRNHQSFDHPLPSEESLSWYSSHTRARQSRKLLGLDSAYCASSLPLSECVSPFGLCVRNAQRRVNTATEYLHTGLRGIVGHLLKGHNALSVDDRSNPRTVICQLIE